MLAMSRYHCPGGVPTKHFAAYHRRRAKGQVGLSITGATAIDRPAANNHPDLANYRPDSYDAWQHVVDEVHAEDGPIMLQLWHAGVAVQCRARLATGADRKPLRPDGPRQAHGRRDDRGDDRRHDRGLCQGRHEGQGAGLRRRRDPCRPRLSDRRILLGRDQPAHRPLGRQDPGRALALRRRGDRGRARRDRAGHAALPPHLAMEGTGLRRQARRKPGRAPRMARSPCRAGRRLPRLLAAPLLGGRNSRAPISISPAGPRSSPACLPSPRARSASIPT